MKTAKSFVISLVVISVCFASCRKIEFKEETLEVESSKQQHPLSRDSLETIYMMQSNPELILADRIISKESGFVLDISAAEARELLISEELYQKYVDKVKELNKIKISN